MLEGNRGRGRGRDALGHCIWSPEMTDHHAIMLWLIKKPALAFPSRKAPPGKLRSFNNPANDPVPQEESKDAPHAAAHLRRQLLSSEGLQAQVPTCAHCTLADWLWKGRRRGHASSWGWE